MARTNITAIKKLKETYERDIKNEYGGKVSESIIRLEKEQRNSNIIIAKKIMDVIEENIPNVKVYKNKCDRYSPTIYEKTITITISSNPISINIDMAARMVDESKKELEEKNNKLAEWEKAALFAAANGKEIPEFVV